MLKYFTMDEFVCSHTGKVEMNVNFLKRLDQLRERCAFPFVITSGFRDETHPNEVEKDSPGTHTMGIAVDVAVSNGYERRRIVEEALKMGFNGVGVAKSFVHVDDRVSPPVIWSY